MNISLKDAGLTSTIIGIFLLMAGPGGSFYSAALVCYIGLIGMFSILVGVLIYTIDNIKHKGKE